MENDLFSTQLEEKIGVLIYEIKRDWTGPVDKGGIFRTPDFKSRYLIIRKVEDLRKKVIAFFLPSASLYTREDPDVKAIYDSLPEDKNLKNLISKILEISSIVISGSPYEKINLTAEMDDLKTLLSDFEMSGKK